MELGPLLKPEVTEELAIQLTHRLYGLDVVGIERMDSYDGLNFHIEVCKHHKNPYIYEVSSDGYTLKITNAKKCASKDNLEFMHSAMLHLNGKGVRVPMAVRNMDGQTWALEEIPFLNEDKEYKGPKQCGIHLLTFLPGVPVYTLPYTTDIFYKWGTLLARFQNATEDLMHPFLKNKTVFWSLEHIPEIGKYMEDIEESKGKLVISVLNRFSSEVEKHMEHLPKGLIHGDFNQNNIIARQMTTESNNKSYFPDGVLDFDDLHYGTYVWDLGVMLAYSLLNCDTMDPLVGAGHALAGYLSLRSLSDLELSLLKIFMECRLCQSLVLCAHTYRSDPSNMYILSSSKTGWSCLEQLSNNSNEDLLEMWKEIQQSYFPQKM